MILEVHLGDISVAVPLLRVVFHEDTARTCRHHKTAASHLEVLPRTSHTLSSLILLLPRQSARRRLCPPAALEAEQDEEQVDEVQVE